MQPSLKDFKPKLLKDLVRIGNASDGGYVVNQRSILNSQYLISFGTYDDWSFEADFLNQKPELEVLCFDYSVSKSIFWKMFLNALSEVFSLRFLLFLLSFNFRAVRQKVSELKYSAKTYWRFSSFFREKVRFFSQGVSNVKDEGFLTLDDVFKLVSQVRLADNSVFIKMDIEQSEFRVLPDLLKAEACISGMVVEFHDLDILWPSFLQIMQRCREHFEITHIHGNNFAGLIPGTDVPKVLEITFLKKSLITQEQEATGVVTYPLRELDRPNNRRLKDYSLHF